MRGLTRLRGRLHRRAKRDQENFQILRDRGRLLHNCDARCGAAYRKYLQHEVSEARAIRSPSGIDSLEAVRIGGIDQWIEVRGQNVNNPILLFIHGGPGVAFIAMGSTFQDPWEKYFTVVQWDQRGAGKTYESNDKELQRRTMNLGQMEQDTVEVANYLRTRFKREKIFVVGHSWGSMLGRWLAHDHAEIVYAFVGTGQAVSMQQNEEAGYAIVLQAPRNRNNAQAIKELESVAPYPPAIPDMNKTGTVGDWESSLLGPPPSETSFTNVKRILRTVISGIFDRRRYRFYPRTNVFTAGDDASDDGIRSDQVGIELPRAAFF